MSHLAELRRRLQFVLIFFMGGAVGGYIGADFLLHVLLQPVLGQVPTAIFTGVPDIFFVYLKLAIYSGLVVAVPALVYQVWRFVRPGLYAHERRLARPWLLATPLLFYGGMLFAHFLVLPLAVEFFFSFQSAQVSALPDVRPYIGFSSKMILAFGVAFTFPAILVLLMQLGIIPLHKLQKSRKYVLVGIVAFAALLTPPDPASQLLLAVPLYLLFEAALLFGKRS